MYGLSDKEIFIYVATSLQHALVLQKLDKETQTRILIKMVEKFCPHLKYSDWTNIFHSVEEIKWDLISELRSCLTEDELLSVADRHLQLFGFSQEEYLKKYNEIKKKINIDEVVKGIGK